MQITVVGGGNIGTQFATECAAKGHAVTVFTSHPEKFSKTVEIVDENDQLIVSGDLQTATGSIKRATENAELLLVTLPAFMLEDFANKIIDYVQPGAIIGVIPGTGGAEFAFSRLIDKGCIVFGLQRVPAVARIKEYGKRVCVIGKREQLHLAAIPQSKGEDLCKLIADIVGIPCSLLANYLTITLTPSNPILHTCRLRVLFGDYFEGKTYPRVPLFYEEWDDDTSQLVLDCDAELQELCSRLNRFDLSQVVSLKKHYESETIEALTNKIRSIKGFRGLPTPMLASGDRFIPDFSSRYFTADFSYGLAILAQLMDLALVAAPQIKSTLRWYEPFSQRAGIFNFDTYGIKSIKDLEAFYHV
jgi:hypothetical protein